MRAPSIARTGQLPIALGDGVAFSLTSDDAGKMLDGRCESWSAGITPAARFWTVTLYNPDGALVANSANRYGFTSQEIVRHADGSFEIVVGAARQPRQLAADRRRRALCAGAAPLRHPGRRLDTKPAAKCRCRTS